jgi:hypothetical protein
MVLPDVEEQRMDHQLAGTALYRRRGVGHRRLQHVFVLPRTSSLAK